MMDYNDFYLQISDILNKAVDIFSIDMFKYLIECDENYKNIHFETIYNHFINVRNNIKNENDASKFFDELIVYLINEPTIKLYDSQFRLIDDKLNYINNKLSHNQ